ncbi:hypothetical protein ACFU7T_04235 [Streptomyces sp. NPDC057555]|uniref:hypothetical protein n=1 Tax=Streptomyces sp. NPDC057555 TaxID=3346166 RepID=UPI003683D7AD
MNAKLRPTGVQQESPRAPAHRRNHLPGNTNTASKRLTKAVARKLISALAGA